MAMLVLPDVFERTWGRRPAPFWADAIAQVRAVSPDFQFMAEVYASALLCEQAEWELREYGDDRKSLVAALYAERYLADRGPLRGIDETASLALEHFDRLVDGALVDDRAR